MLNNMEEVESERWEFFSGVIGNRNRIQISINIRFS